MKKKIIFLLLFVACFESINAQKQVCDDIGMNLFYVNYWSREVPFSNLMMQASPWIACNQDWKFKEKDNYLWSDKIEKDTNGYPTRLPQNIVGQTKPQTVLSYLALDNGGILPKGKYTLRYDGEGEIELFGMDSILIVSKQQGKIEFNLKAIRPLSEKFDSLGGSLGFIIRSSTQGNHIRNIRILLPNVKETDTNYPFNAAFLAKLKPFSAIRFMNWAGAYWSSDVEWINRRKPTYYTQFNVDKSWETRSVSYEYMIQLCNLLDRDMWLNMPYQASENYVAALGQLVLKNLKPNLKVYLEYGNEVWSVGDLNLSSKDDAFERQYNYVKEKAPNALQNQDHQYRYAHFCNQTFKAFNPTKSAQVVRVISGQQGNYSVLQRSIQGMAFIAAANEFDAGSVTDYMFQQEALNSLPQKPNLRDVATAFRGAMKTSLDYLQANLNQLQTSGKQMITYEGGVHALTSPTNNNRQILLDFAKDTSFYNISREWLAKVKALGNIKMQMGFVLADNQYGHWNLQNIFTDDASNSLKYKALIDHCGISTNTENIDNQLLMKIFPNPANEELYLDFETNKTSLIRIFDLAGRLLLSQKNTAMHTSLSVDFLPKGLYLIMVESEGKKGITKFIKN